MADIKVKIEVNQNAETERLGNIRNDNASLSNVSIPTSMEVFQNIPSHINHSKGSNGLTWAYEDKDGDNYLVFNENDYVDNVENSNGYIESEYNPTEFVWGIVPESKQYNVRLTFVNAKNLKDIIIYGDSVSGQFPTRAIIDDTTEIFSDDNRWAINFKEEKNIHTIEFTHWNRANYNACITLIAVMLKYFEVDKSNAIKSVESLSQSTGQPNEIFYGIVPNDGELKIIDLDNEIREMVNEEIIKNSNATIELFVNNKKIQEHISTNSSYNENNKILNMQMDNILSTWENIYITSRNGNYSDNLYDILKDNFKKVGLYESYLEAMCVNEIIYGNNKVGTVKQYLQSIEVQYVYNNETTLKDIVENICVIAQLNIYQDNNGQILFTTARPRANANKSIISIPQRCQLSNFDYDLILKNKYDSIRFPQYVLYETLQTVFTLDANFKDSSHNLTLENIGDNVQILTGSDGYQYLCFFKTVSTSSNAMQFMDVYKKYNVHCSHIEVNEYSGSGHHSKSADVMFASESETKENFNFLEYNSRVIVLPKYSTVNSVVVAFKIRIYDDQDMNLKIKLFARCFDRNQEVVQIGNGSNVYEYNFENDWLLSTTSLIDGDSKINIYDIITQNILSDYKNGIKTAKVTIACVDYFDIYGNKTIDWSNGETISVDDIVRIDKDNELNSLLKYSNGDDVYFKVVGKRFRKEGVPLIDLELMEIIQTDIPNTDYATITFYVGEEKYIQNVRLGGHLTIPISPYKDGHIFYGWSIDGKTKTEVQQENITENKTYYALFSRNDTELAKSLVATMVDNGTLLFDNFKTVFEDNGYNIDWENSNMQYSLLANSYDMNGRESPVEVPIFTLNKLTYGTSIEIKDMTLEYNAAHKYITKNSCKINIGKDYSLQFIDNDFAVQLVLSPMPPSDDAFYKIVLSSSNLLVITR